MKQPGRTELHMGCGEPLRCRCRTAKKLLEAKRRSAFMKSRLLRQQRDTNEGSGEK